MNNSSLTNNRNISITVPEKSINWLGFNEKTLKKAKVEHKPIFLFIGYS